ncbi:hypothetical protein J1C56_02075 [Aminobacter anthyllidis]|uniref:Uncharacterized protein n=1 Tax=Aminobacter anthyllidis TaxID=1035067 RepID=A0A9X1A7K0_9HYPH|nr:hypothetical protein [Aminobacter anthyllidis]MBT1154372.1 hypothetical protein [Aminobacter anthyllidis]
MTNPRFDANRPFGSIHPPYNGAMYEQDSCFFSGSYEFLFREGQQEPARVQEKAGAPAPVPPAPQQAPKVEAPVVVAPVAKTEPVKDGVDLAAWARGEAKYAFFSIKKEVAAAYPSIETTNAASIVAGLVAAGVVAEADVKR